MDDEVREGDQRLIAAGEPAPAASTHAAPIAADEGHPARSRRGFVAAATAGALLLTAYAYGAFRWGPLDDVTVLALLFGVLLLGYAALAIAGVRGGVIAPFVVAALLLPWACGAAAFAGATQRVVTAVDDFSDVSSLEEIPSAEPPQETPSAEALVNPDGDITAQPSTDARPSATPMGDPVPFSTAGELGVVKWAVTVTDMECAIASIPRAEVSEDGTGKASTARPSKGNEFCLLHTKWKNVGEVASMPVFPGNLIIDGEQVAHEQRDQARSFAVTSDQLGVDLLGYVEPGKSVKEIEVYEVPQGSVPEAVWIAFHDPKALAATA